MNKQITILDYGMCNLLNVARAFEHVGAEVTITDSAQVANDATRLVVPGVGAFKDSIAEVQRRGFDELIHKFVGSGRPFLGICVGMQMLFDASEEFGEHAGLGVLPGVVRAVPGTTIDGVMQRVPHIGWSELVPAVQGRSWENTLLSSCSDVLNPAMYFVHSFAAQPANEDDRLADCLYGGHRICAAVQRENIMATQFHPERSAELGLQVLRHFVSM